MRSPPSTVAVALGSAAWWFVMSTILDRSRSEEHTSELQSHLNLVCRLLLEKKNSLQRTQRGFLGQARQGTLLAVPAGRDQARGNAGAGDVPRTAGRGGPVALPCEDPGTDTQLAAVRSALAVAQTGLARQLSRAEADLVPAAAGGARVRCGLAGFGETGIRRLALERLLGTSGIGNRFQARGIPARAHGARPLSVSRPGPQTSSRGNRIALTPGRPPARRPAATEYVRPVLCPDGSGPRALSCLTAGRSRYYPWSTH